MFNRPKKTTGGSRKPIKLGAAGLSSPNMNDMDAFINNEMKALNKKNQNQSPNPKVLDRRPIMLNYQHKNPNNPLRDSKDLMKPKSNKSFGNQKIDENMGVSQTKFEGFSNATKFSETNTSNMFKEEPLPVETKSRVPTATNKPENFVIKFPQEQAQKEKTKEILKKLKNDSFINNAIENVKGLKPENEKKDFGQKKGAYIESYNKIESKPKNIFGDEEIEEDYNDFENVEDKKNDIKNESKKNDWEDMFGENAQFNNVDEDQILKPQKICKDKSKRDQIIERLNDIKNLILLSDEYLDLYSFDKSNENNLDDMDDEINNKKQEIAINTDPIIYKDKGTATDENYDINNTNNNNEDNEENDDEKENTFRDYNNKDNLVNKEKKAQIIVSSYQPLTYDAYNVFIKTAPAIENMLLNNINKYILQNKNGNKPQENTGMSKLSMEFNFPVDLLDYMFPNNKSEKVKIDINKFLFFDTKPYLIAISLSLSTEFSPILAPIFGDNFENISSANIIILFDFVSIKISKILYSSSKINDMIAIGEGENILISARIDGELDVYDISLKEENNSKMETDDKYFMGFEKNNFVSLSRLNVENNKNQNTDPKFKLILPLFSSSIYKNNYNDPSFDNNNKGFNSEIKKMIKVVNKNIENTNFIEKLYEIFLIDITGYLISLKFSESNISSLQILENKFNTPSISFDFNPLLKRVFNTLPDNGNQNNENLLTEIYDVKYYKDNQLYILCNFGLCKISIEGKDTFLSDPIYYSIQNENYMTAFDVSDLGYVACSFNDKSVKIIDSNNKNIIYSSVVDNLSESTLINNVMWSKVICKNKNNKLIRRTLLANFFILTSKNEFIIYDLNQKKLDQIRKVKKYKDMGKTQNLTRKNSLMDMSETLFTDYSNFITMSECNQSNNAKFIIYKLSLRKQYYEESNIMKVNDKIIGKMMSLLNN